MRRLPITVLIFLVCIGLHAQDAAIDREADHAELRQILTEITDALNRRDAEAAASYFAKDFAFTALNQRTMTTQQEIADFVDEMFSGPTAPLTDLQLEPVASIKTVFTGPDTGYCYGTARETYTLAHGGTTVLQTHWTATVVREDGVWKTSTLHVGVDPLANPILAAASKTTGSTMLFLLVLGIAIGAALGAYIKRRSSPEATE